MKENEALAYLKERSGVFCKPGPERAEELCRRMGEPQRGLAVVHVAGTNGKGSFCGMLTEVLSKAGYRTGRFTSPALTEVYEQITVDGVPISPADFAGLVETLRPAAESMADKPTAFELLTVLALLYFRRRQCDIAVMECGMGGAQDATNLSFSPLLSVITGVSVDHAAYLGNTVAAIAREKAGIARAGVPLLYGGRDESAASVIRAVADGVGAPFCRVAGTPETESASLAGSVFSYAEWKHVVLRVPGVYQPENACRVLAAVMLLRKAGLSLPEAAVRAGLAAFRLPGRTEVLGMLGNNPVIYDGAHNPEGIAAARAAIEKYAGGRVILLCGVMADKEYEKMAALLAPLCLYVYTVCPDNPRALPAPALASVFRRAGTQAEAAKTVAAGLRAAAQASRAENVPLFCLGSLYMYREVRAALAGAGIGKE